MNNKFQYSCIGSNTKENREHLEKIGYPYMWVDERESILYTTKISGNWFYNTTDSLFPNSYIDCRNNPALFRAVTAMRSDSDYLQWFICTTSLSDCATCKGEFTLSYDKVFQTSRMDGSFWRKATLAELIEHFYYS